MKLLKDRVLLKLPPPQVTTESGLHLEPVFAPVETRGKVVMTGPDVKNVQIGDLVVFGPEALGSTLGPPYVPTPHLILRESEIRAIVEKRTA